MTSSGSCVLYWVRLPARGQNDVSCKYPVGLINQRPCNDWSNRRTEAFKLLDENDDEVGNPRLPRRRRQQARPNTQNQRPTRR